MKRPSGNEIIKFLNDKWHGAVCPLCNCSEWNVSDQIFELREFKDGNLALDKGTAIVPIIPVTCKNCGNTVLINALHAKLLKE